MAKTKQKRTAPAPTPADDELTPGADRASAALQKLQVTALAWVSILRIRVKELVDEIDSVTGMSSSPRYSGAVRALRGALDIPALNAVYNHMYQVDEMLERTIGPDTTEPVPRLDDVCVEAALAMGFSSEEPT